MQQHAEAIRDCENWECKLDEIASINAKCHKSMYLLFVFKRFGHSGKGQRIELPQYILDKIRIFFWIQLEITWDTKRSRLEIISRPIQPFRVSALIFPFAL